MMEVHAGGATAADGGGPRYRSHRSHRHRNVVESPAHFDAVHDRDGSSGEWAPAVDDADADRRGRRDKRDGSQRRRQHRRHRSRNHDGSNIEDDRDYRHRHRDRHHHHSRNQVDTHFGAAGSDRSDGELVDVDDHRQRRRHRRHHDADVNDDRKPRHHLTRQVAQPKPRYRSWNTKGAIESLAPSLDYGDEIDRASAPSRDAAIREAELKRRVQAAYAPSEIAKRSPVTRRKPRKMASGSAMERLNGPRGPPKFVQKPDFNTAPVKSSKPVIESLGFLKPEPYSGGRSPSPSRKGKGKAGGQPGSGALVVLESKGQTDRVEWKSSTTKVDILEKTSLPKLDYEPPPKILIAGDMGRHANTHVGFREQSRFISPKDWEASHIEPHRREPSVILTSPVPPDGGPAISNGTFLTQVPEDDETALSEDQYDVVPRDAPRSDSMGTRALGEKVPVPKVLRKKPHFDPTGYVERQKTRMIEESSRRIELVQSGVNPNKINMLKFKDREKPIFVVKPKPRKAWHTDEVKSQLDELIKVENIKLKVLDALHHNLTKGEMAGMMEERLEPLRQSIKGVRARINHHREAKNLVAKQTWHADLKQLRIGGSKGMSLDQYLCVISDMCMEDKMLITDDHPGLHVEPMG